MERKNVLKLIAMAGVCVAFLFIPASLAFSDYADDLLVDSYYNDILDVVSAQDDMYEASDVIRGDDTVSYMEESRYGAEDILTTDVVSEGDDILAHDEVSPVDDSSGVVDLAAAADNSSSSSSGSSYTVTYDPGSIDEDILITKPAAATPIPTPKPSEVKTVKAAMATETEKASLADNSKAPVNTAASSSAIESVINQINQKRIAAGVAPVSSDSVLNYVAAQRVKETTQKFSHKRPNGKDSITILTDYGVDAGRCGENIACCISTPEGVVSAWSNSPSHNRCMMNPDYTNAGVGTVVSGGCTYWVLILTN